MVRTRKLVTAPLWRVPQLYTSSGVSSNIYWSRITQPPITRRDGADDDGGKDSYITEDELKRCERVDTGSGRSIHRRKLIVDWRENYLAQSSSPLNEPSKIQRKNPTDNSSFYSRVSQISLLLIHCSTPRTWRSLNMQAIYLKSSGSTV